jgi:hypothetical protein
MCTVVFVMSAPLKFEVNFFLHEQKDLQNTASKYFYTKQKRTVFKNHSSIIPYLFLKKDETDLQELQRFCLFFFFWSPLDTYSEYYAKITGSSFCITAS